MIKKSNFRKLVINVLNRYEFSAGGFGKFSGIPPRTVQHLVHGDHGSFNIVNQRKFDGALEKLRQTPVSNLKDGGFIDFSASQLPVCMKIGNLVITFEETEDVYLDKKSTR
jgi:hypothetical protein